MTPTEYVIERRRRIATRVPRTPQALPPPVGELPDFVEYTNGSYRATYGFDGYADLDENRALVRHRYLRLGEFLVRSELAVLEDAGRAISPLRSRSASASTPAQSNASARPATTSSTTPSGSTATSI